MIKRKISIDQKLSSFSVFDNFIFNIPEGGGEVPEISRVAGEGVYTTWKDDPCTNIMLHFITFDTSTHTGMYRIEGSGNWQEVPETYNKPYPLTNKRVKWFELSGLTPNSIYEFKVKGYTEIDRFKTMPLTNEGVKVLATSDQMNELHTFYTNVVNDSEAIKLIDPDVFVIAGDVVHDDATRVTAWDVFWKGWFDNVKSSNGLLIPIVAVLGNHDGKKVDENGGYVTLLWHHMGARVEDVVFFYNFFSNIDETGYGVLDISDYLSFVYTDTGHTNDVLKTQVSWLESTLQARQDREVLPIMHVSPYPGRYKFDTYTHIRVREHWTPLFTNNGIKAVVTGHEHVSLATHKVTGDTLDPNGVVYIGQGRGMGSDIRQATATNETWYVDYLADNTQKTDEVRGFESIYITGDGVLVEKMTMKGETVYSKQL